MARLRVLVVGDPFFQVPDFRRGLSALESRASLSYLQIETTGAPPARTESERRLREYAGDPAEVAAAVAGHDVLIVHGAPVSAEVLAADGLRLVCCARGGPVNVDLDAATAAGVTVCNTPGKNAEAVAELTIAFALMHIRSIAPSSGEKPGPTVFDGRRYFGTEAASTTLGLVGLGHVGRGVARRARALGFTVLAHDPYVQDARDAELTGLDDLLARSDVVSLHARATPQTRHMIGERELGAMRPGAFLINTAREQLVDEPALLAALRAWPAGRGGPGRPGAHRWPEPAARPAPGDRDPAHRRRDVRDAPARRRDGGPLGDRADRGRGTAVRRQHRSPPPPQRCGVTGRYLLAIDAGTGSCRAVLFDEKARQVGVSLREWIHHAPPGVPGGAGLRRRRRLGADLRLRPRRPRAYGRRRARRRRRQHHEHARGHRHLRRRRPGDLGLPERRQPRHPRGRGPRTVRRGRTHLRHRRRLGLDHLARPAAVARRAPAGRAGPRRRYRPAQRLDRAPAQRGPGHRTVVRVELGHVRPGGTPVVGRDRRDVRPARRTCCPPSTSREPASAR